MNSHLKTAHQYGVNEALKKCGYATVEDVTKEAAELGLLETPPTEPTNDVFNVLKKKLG
jgi:hypothetical protein